MATLINSTEEEEGDDEKYVTYQYRGYSKEVNQFVVYGAFYEWYDYLLIDGVTGDTTDLCGIPIVSPGKKQLISGNADLDAGYTFNGIELYDDSHPPNILASRELTKWGPKIIKWKDDNTLYIEASVLDSTGEKTDYFKLTLNRFESAMKPLVN
jgi:hypothetical protein